MGKIKKDAEYAGHDVKKGAEYAGHDVKKGAEYAGHDVKKGAKSVFNKMKKALQRPERARRKGESQMVLGHWAVLVGYRAIHK